MGMTVNEMNSISPQHFWGNVDITNLYWLIWDCTVACYLRRFIIRRLGGRELKERLADYPVLYLTPISIHVTRRSFAVEDSLVAVR